MHQDTDGVFLVDLLSLLRKCFLLPWCITKSQCLGPHRICCFVFFFYVSQFFNSIVFIVSWNSWIRYLQLEMRKPWMIGTWVRTEEFGAVKLWIDVQCICKMWKLINTSPILIEVISLRGKELLHTDFVAPKQWIFLLLFIMFEKSDIQMLYRLVRS